MGHTPHARRGHPIYGSREMNTPVKGAKMKLTEPAGRAGAGAAAPALDVAGRYLVVLGASHERRMGAPGSLRKRPGRR